MKLQDKIIGGIVILVILIGGIVFANKNEYSAAEEIPDMLTAITLDEFVDLYNGDDLVLLYVARPTCSYCTMFHPIVNEVIDEYDVPFYYYDIDTMSGDDMETFIETATYFQDGIGTPTTLLVQDGELVDVLAGYVEKDGLVSFLLENGMIEEE